MLNGNTIERNNATEWKDVKNDTEKGSLQTCLLDSKKF